MERCVFGLGRFGDFSVEFGRGSLVYAAFFLKSEYAYGLEQPQGADCIGFGGVFWHIERYFYMALCRKIIYLVGADFSYDSDKRRGIGHVPVMEVDEPSGVHVAHPAFEVEMFYPFGIETGAAAYYSMYVVAFFEQEFGQIRAVLSCYSGD